MPNYALKVRCLHEERIIPSGLLGTAYGCNLCGSYMTVQIVQLPDDPPETRRWPEVKATYDRLEERLVQKGPVVSYRADHDFPAHEEDHRGTILGGRRESRSPRLWCAPCLSTLWGRMRQDHPTFVDRSTSLCSCTNTAGANGEYWCSECGARVE